MEKIIILIILLVSSPFCFAGQGSGGGGVGIVKPIDDVFAIMTVSKSLYEEIQKTLVDFEFVEIPSESLTVIVEDGIIFDPEKKVILKMNLLFN